MQTIPVKMGGKLTPPIARLAAKTSDFLFSRICCSLKHNKEPSDYTAWFFTRTKNYPYILRSTDNEAYL